MAPRFRDLERGWKTPVKLALLFVDLGECPDNMYFLTFLSFQAFSQTPRIM